MRKILPVLLVIILGISGIQAIASEFPDYDTWLSEYDGSAKLKTSLSFLYTVEKYNLVPIVWGATSSGDEIISLVLHNEAIDDYCEWSILFSQDNSVFLLVDNLLTIQSGLYGVAEDICKAIATEYGSYLFVPQEETNKVFFGYSMDLSDYEDVGSSVLGAIVYFNDVINEEYSRFSAITLNEESESNTFTPSPQPTATPEPTPTPTPEPTATPTPIPTASNSSTSSGATLDPLLVERFGTPSGFAYFYNDLAIDSLLEGTMPGIDAQMKKAFHLTYSENDSAINGNPTYQTDMGFSLVFYCDDVDTRANKMEFIGDFANLDAATVSSITGMVAEIYALSVGADAEESDIAGNNCILFALGIKTNYENELFSMTYKADNTGNTHITFERK